MSPDRKIDHRQPHEQNDALPEDIRCDYAKVKPHRFAEGVEAGQRLTLLRRDEIWFVEKSPSGSSIVYSLEEFKPRHDLDIRKDYLQGRFGVIPILGSALDVNPLAA